MMKNRFFPRAYTLLEILTVIAIIAVIIAIAFPVISKARFKAYQPICVSNMRQVSMALNMYRQDYDGAESGNHYTQLGLPEFGAPLSENHIANKRIYNLFASQYVKDRRVLLCPTEGQNYLKFPGYPSTYIFYSNYIIRYGWLGSDKYIEKQLNFAEKYSSDPTFPALVCHKHDLEYISRYGSDNSKPNADFLGVGLNGGISHLRRDEIYPPLK